MPRQKTREELEDRIDELEAENETLQDQVDSIADIIEGEEEEDNEGEDDEGKTSASLAQVGVRKLTNRPTAQAKSRRMSPSRKALPVVWWDCPVDGCSR